MNNIILPIISIITFVRENAGQIILIIGVIFTFFVGFTVTEKSLKKLKPETITYYPFDRFFPNSGKWSVVYFLITILLLGILVYAIIKGGFYLSPA